MTPPVMVVYDRCTPRCRDRLRYTGQVVLAFVVVFPLDVLFWRGTWDLFDYFVVVDCRQSAANLSHAHANGLEHENHDAKCVEYTGNWISAALGLSACVLLNCASPLMQSMADSCRELSFQVTSRLYSYAFAIAYLGQWRGTWNLVDAFCNDYHWRSNLAGFAVCLAMNFLLRLNQFWVSSPWEIRVDTDRELFVSTPWLRSRPEDGMWRYCIDQLLSQVICVNLNVSTWRCLWNIFDDTVYPDKLLLSASLTLFSGAAVLLFVILIQNAIVLCGATLDNKHFQRSLVDGCFYIVVNSSVVSMWRGLWNLMAEYVLPDKLIGGLVCHALGTICLMAVMSFNTTYDNSVDIDGEEGAEISFRPSLIPATGWTELRKNKTQMNNKDYKQNDDMSTAKAHESNNEDLLSDSDNSESV